MTIDFLTPNDIGSLRTRVISEETVAAMYMNNRAAEAIARQQLDNAYGWAHAAIVQDPHYLPSYNTLGIIYKRHGNPHQAEQLFKRILAIEPENTIAMSNLVLVLNEQGRTAEAGDLAQTLKRIRPYPPFHFFDLGMAAMKQNNFAVAKAMFTREVEREAYYDKFHFWLALAYYQLGDLRNARKHLVIAEQTSTTSSAHALYAGKLARLRSAHVP